jgi:F-type H+-transporting ATPase subunit epsilon
MSIKLQIVTPEGTTFSDEVENVYLPGADGEFGVLSLHTALVSSLKPGNLRYEKDGKLIELAIGGGFAQVNQQQATILTDMAKDADEIDAKAVELALHEAKHALSEVDPFSDPEEYKRLQNNLARNEALLNLFKKQH